MEWHRFLSHLLVTEMLTVKKVWIWNSRNKTFFASSGGFSYCFTTYTPHAPTLMSLLPLPPCHEPEGMLQGGASREGPAGRGPGVLPCMWRFWDSKYHISTILSSSSGLSKKTRKPGGMLAPLGFWELLLGHSFLRLEPYQQARWKVLCQGNWCPWGSQT